MSADAVVRNKLIPETLPDKFYDAEIRLEKVVSLAFCPDLEALSVDAEEMLGDYEGLLRETGIAAPAIQDDDDLDNLPELARILLDYGFNGYFVHCSRPIFERRGKHKHFSWGYYTSQWFYGDTLDQALERALVMAERPDEQSKGADVR